MGHGKETPRQKMIGMMYLVLTALLALNVSADILNAFVLVDESLVRATEIFVEKNNTSYEIFDAQMEKAASKVGPFRDKAYQVKEKADQLAYDIQKLKADLIEFADGKDARKETLIPMHWMIGRGDNAKNLETFSYDGMKIHGKDQTDKPAQMMLLKNPFTNEEESGKKIKGKDNQIQRISSGIN